MASGTSSIKSDFSGNEKGEGRGKRTNLPAESTQEETTSPEFPLHTLNYIPLPRILSPNYKEGWLEM